jgi:hypothetical protein
MPIETAPKDGTEILIRVPLDWSEGGREKDEPRIGSGFHVESCWYVVGKNIWKNRLAGFISGDRPTHWMPYKEPKPPKED